MLLFQRAVIPGMLLTVIILCDLEVILYIIVVLPMRKFLDRTL